MGNATVFADYRLVRQAIGEKNRAQIIDSRVDRSNRDVLPSDDVGLEVPATAYPSSSCVLEPADEALRFRRGSERRELFKGAGIDPRGWKITTCYFGLGASIVATALEIAGFDPVLVEYAVKQGLVQSC